MKKRKGREEIDRARKKTGKPKIKTGAKDSVPTGGNEPASTQNYFHQIGQM